MRDPLTTYLSALVSSSAVFRFGGESWPWVAFLAAISALVGTALFAGISKSWRATGPIRAEWHLSRAATLREGSAATSGAWRAAASVWAGYALAQVLGGVHAVAAGAL